MDYKRWLQHINIESCEILGKDPPTVGEDEVCVQVFLVLETWKHSDLLVSELCFEWHILCTVKTMAREI